LYQTTWTPGYPGLWRR